MKMNNYYLLMTFSNDYPLSFLVWLQENIKPNEMYREMLALEISEDVAAYFKMYLDQKRRSGLISLIQDFSRDDDEHAEKSQALSLYLKHVKKSWDKTQ